MATKTTIKTKVTGDKLPASEFNQLNDNYNELVDDVIKNMILSGSYLISNAVYDDDGNISSANLTWADGEEGSISNVETDDYGITSIRFNRPDKYATLSITRENGEVTETTLTITTL